MILELYLAITRRGLPPGHMEHGVLSTLLTALLVESLLEGTDLYLCAPVVMSVTQPTDETHPLTIIVS